MEAVQIPDSAVRCFMVPNYFLWDEPASLWARLVLVVDADLQGEIPAGIYVSPELGLYSDDEIRMIACVTADAPFPCWVGEHVYVLAGWLEEICPEDLKEGIREVVHHTVMTMQKDPQAIFEEVNHDYANSLY